MISIVRIDIIMMVIVIVCLDGDVQCTDGQLYGITYGDSAADDDDEDNDDNCNVSSIFFSSSIDW